MALCIHLCATGRNIPLPAYVAGIRAAIANPQQTFKHGLETWWPVTGEEVRGEYRRAMHDRINAKVSHYGRGRKWSRDWQRGARDMAWRFNGNRIVTRERDCPAELRARLRHRFCDDLD